MGLLASCGLAGNRQQRIDIYGPKPLNDYLQASRRYSQTHFSLPIKIHAVEPGVVFEDDEFRVVCDLLEHRVPAYGYRVEERDRPGHFDVKRAQALGIPPGPIYGQLKQGQRVTLPNGRTVHGADLCGPDLVGRKLVYCTDTIYCDRAVALASQADVLIHEATFSHRDADLAYQRLHSTSTMAAQVALAAQVKQLIMTHFSPRYAPGNDIQLSDLLAEAQAIFPQTTMAHDFLIYDIPRQEERVLASSSS
jgi:ribonuclease Z